MSTTVDDRVVSMRFDNKQFEQNVKTSMNTLDKLKKSLNLEGAAKGLENISIKAKNFNLSGLHNSIEGVKNRFSALEVMGVTALVNITNSAVNAGKRITSALTIEPVKMGLEEYETQINAVQTILANTQSKGTTLDQVNKALDELNHYADLTIYNFTEMTRNIGTFTAAGVDLDTSVSAIKGISNLAAVSGSNSQQASTAMYQLSQALAAGTVKLQDWNSVVNAGMGGQVFQDSLKETARAHGIAIDEMIKKEGSFRETLQNGWLSSEILTETLSKFTGDLTDKQLKSMGYTDKQIKDIQKLGKTANDAATKVKTFTQLKDTLGEALQSGWTQTWEILIGDFEEAKSLWTDVSDYFSDVINKSAEARNNLLQGWADNGGRQMAIESIKNVFNGLLSILKPIKEAFREVFPPATSKQLLNITTKIKNLTEHFKLSGSQAEKLKKTFTGVFSVFDIGTQVIASILKSIGTFITGGAVGNILDGILSITSGIGTLFTTLDNGLKSGNVFSAISDIITGALTGISTAISVVLKGFGGMDNVFSTIGKVILGVINIIKDGLGWIKNNISVGDIFVGLSGGGIFMVAKKFAGIIDTVKEALDGFVNKKSEISTSKISDILEGVHNSLEAFANGIKTTSLVGIAVAVTLLTSSLRKISEISPDKIAYSLGAIHLLIKSLNSGFQNLSKVLLNFKAKGTLQAGITIIAMAKAIDILATAMLKISGLSLGGLAKGLIGITTMLSILSKSMSSINNNSVTITTSVAIITLAKACEMLSQAFVKFGSMSWSEIGRGLTAMGGALIEFVGALEILNKINGGGLLSRSMSILIISKSLDEIAESLISLGGLSWSEIGRGLIAMGGALAELGIASGLLGKLAGISSVLGSGAIVLLANALGKIASSLEKLGDLSWGEIERGLVAMGGALAELGAVSGLLGKIAGMAGIVGAGSIVIVAKSLEPICNTLQKFGIMSWSEIGRGLTAMGGALGELAAIVGILGKIAGVAGIVGAASILLAVQGLDEIADSLQKFGHMSWDEVTRGLTAMGGALLEIGVVSGALGSLTGIASLAGAGTITLASKGLSDIADALQKFGAMSWGEIGKGLAAMAGALGTTGIGSLLNTFSGLGASSISNIAEPLGILAESLQKFGSMPFDEIARGLTSMSVAMGEVALGSFLNTLSGLGSLSLSKVAEPLGILADSVKKWADVEVPENLSDQIGSLASAIKKFTFGGLGADALSKAAPCIGILGDSIKKWKDVILPDDLESKLTSIANGVKAFSFSFAGGMSLETICSPIGTLADSMKKWINVKIPEDVATSLKNLASGVKEFNFVFTGGWSISTVAEPMGVLAESIKKWTNITVPENFKDNLKNVADGIKEFGVMDSLKIKAIASPLNMLGDSFKKFSGIQNTGNSLVVFAKNIEKCASQLTNINTTGLSNVSALIGALAKALKDANSTNVDNIGKFVSAANKLNNIKVDNVKVDTNGLSSAVKSVKSTMSSMKNTVSSSKSSLTSATKSAISGMSSAIKANSGNVRKAGESLMNSLASAIKGKKNNITSATKTATSGGSSGAKQNRGGYESAGRYLGEGLVVGIQAKEDAAYQAGYELGQKSAQGVKAGSKEHSPSKLTIQYGEYLGEGLVIGIKRWDNKAYNAGYRIGKTAANSVGNAIRRISNLITDNVDTSPTIRPVMDLSNVKQGVGSIGNMVGGINPSMQLLTNVGTISSSMSRNRQNGTNNDIVSAIKDLSDAMSKSKGTTNIINGVTYDDGSNIVDAIETIVREAKVDRRA